VIAVEGEKHLDERVKIVWLSGTAITLFVFTAVATAAFLIFSDQIVIYGIPRSSFLMIIFGVDLIIGAPVYIWNELTYRNFTYALRHNDILIRQGVITRKNIIIPYVTIQDITTERTLLERALGIATILIETAGSSRAAAETPLPGIANKDEVIVDILERVRHAKGVSSIASITVKRPIEDLLEAVIDELREISIKLDEIVPPKKYKMVPNPPVFGKSAGI
jgi:membrane protein YdbS with pleckstrin-like domain